MVDITILKFGGSALATPDGIRRAAARTALIAENSNKVIVVADAMGDNFTTLGALTEQVCHSPKERELDLLRSTGEQLSAALLAMAISGIGYDAVALTGWQAGITTDSFHTKANIVNIDSRRIMDELSRGNVVVIAGAQGVDSIGDITTLGRDGADTTAVALAAWLRVDRVELFTDTDGLFTADPRLVPAARQIPRISYDETLELITLGAGVMQPRAVEYAKRFGITLHLRSSFTSLSGTIIGEDESMQTEVSVRGVAHDTNVTKLVLVGVPDQPGIAYKVFEGLASAHINVDMIVQSQKDESTNDILFTCERQDAATAMTIIEKIAGELKAKGVARDDRVAKVSIIGAGMANNSGIAARMFGALAKHSINIEVISTSEIRISCLIPAAKVEEAVRAIHLEFGLENG